MSDTPNADEFLDTLFSVPSKEIEMQQQSPLEALVKAVESKKVKRTASVGGALGVLILLAFTAVVVTGAVWAVVEIWTAIPR